MKGRTFQLELSFRYHKGLGRTESCLRGREKRKETTQLRGQGAWRLECKRTASDGVTQ